MKKHKKQKSKVSYKILALFVSFTAVAMLYTWAHFVISTLSPVAVSAEVPRKATTTPEKEPTMQEWVMQQIRESGISEYEAWAVINGESRWNPDAVNVNSNKTYDAGLWQINSIHKLTNACKFDYKCATKWAIEKRLHDGNWSAWYAARTQGIK